jgi:hypothetical protein
MQANLRMSPKRLQGFKKSKTAEHVQYKIQVSNDESIQWLTINIYMVTTLENEDSEKNSKA